MQIGRIMYFYYAGFNTSPLFSKQGRVSLAVDSFTKVSYPGITDFQIGWSYFLLWIGDELYITKQYDKNNRDADAIVQLLQVPGKSPNSCKQAAPGKDSIVILCKDNEIWQYRMYENSWKKVNHFIGNIRSSGNEYPTKIVQGGCTVTLTNLGRIYNIPALVHMPKRVKFIDIACGYEHTLCLAEGGDIYSMGIGTHGQLGHNDLEDCDRPKLVEALAGIRVVQISAAGWHNTAVTDQGDLYTWGWNNNGQLGLLNQDCKVIAVPTLVNFTDDENRDLEISVKKAECGSTFTVCLTQDDTLWGCGSNKYGQLGLPRNDPSCSEKFIPLNVPRDAAEIKDFKCNEWGTVLVTT